MQSEHWPTQLTKNSFQLLQSKKFSTKHFNNLNFLSSKILLKRLCIIHILSLSHHSPHAQCTCWYDVPDTFQVVHSGGNSGYLDNIRHKGTRESSTCHSVAPARRSDWPPYLFADQSHVLRETHHDATLLIRTYHTNLKTQLIKPNTNHLPFCIG